jgi:transposase
MKANANSTTVSEASGGSSVGHPENGVGRQATTVSGMSMADVGHTEDGVERQAQPPRRLSLAGVAHPEAKVERQVAPANNTVMRRYTFKLYPNKAQTAALQRQAALLAMLWNAALEQREAQWAQECQRKPKGERKGLNKFDQGRDLKFIRADDPEFAAMSSDTMNLCLIALDDAFKAFFKRAKGGAGKSSGYPKYKSPYAIENKGADCTIWHRDAPKGWRMERSGKHFRIYAKGISDLKDRSTWIKARGRFPVDFENVEVRDMRLIRVGGIWQCSVVVRMEARREKIATAPNATVEFNLIDEFASVKIGANGECLPGWADEFLSPNEQISPKNRGVKEATACESLDVGAEGRQRPPRTFPAAACESIESGADGRKNCSSHVQPQACESLTTDSIQSEGDTRFKRGSYRWKQNRKRVAKRKAKEARQRKEALHHWTTRLIAGVKELTVVCPPIKDSTRSARGNEANHGAAVKTVALLNRHVLAQAPAMAIQMLEYKANEAGIPFARITPDEHALSVGRELPAAVKAVRKARRAIKTVEEITHV